jgi:DNA polymerase-3 subunit chi
MKKADFYILAGADDESRQQFLGKLLNRIMRTELQVYLYCADQFNAEKLSELLWQFQATSFLANCLVTDEHKARISLGWPDQHQPSHHQVIINLTDHIPSDAAQFERIAEIVTQQPDSLLASRERYKNYRSEGYEIQHNDMRSKPQR